MIKLKDVGLNITEQEYRDLAYPSYSILSGISRDGVKAFSDEVDQESEPILHGDIVDKMMDGSYNPDDYHISNNVSLGDGLKNAVDAIFNHMKIKNDIGPSGELADLTDEVEKFLDTNHVDYYAKKTAEWTANKICSDAAAQAYFRDKWMSLGKVVVDRSLLIRCEENAKKFREHDFTRHIFREDTGDVESVNQLKFVSHNKKNPNNSFKVMFDRIVIDHGEKKIYPYDVKTGGKSALEFEGSFFYWRYDIQATLYTIACVDIRDEFYPDYTVEDFRFVYIGRTENKPLVWRVPDKILYATLDGYVRNGRYYKGVRELLKEYNWYIQNNLMVSYPEEVYLNNGEMVIDTKHIMSDD